MTRTVTAHGRILVVDDHLPPESRNVDAIQAKLKTFRREDHLPAEYKDKVVGLMSRGWAMPKNPEVFRVQWVLKEPPPAAATLF